LKLVEADRRNISLQSLETFLQRTRETLEKDTSALAVQRQHLDAAEARIVVRQSQFEARASQIEALARTQAEQQRLLDERAVAHQAKANELANLESELNARHLDLRTLLDRHEQDRKAHELSVQPTSRCCWLAWIPAATS